MSRLALLLVVIASTLSACQGFSTAPRVTRTSKTISRDSVALNVGNLFGGILGGNKQQGDPNTPTRVLDIPAKSVKVGGLRFFLGIYLVGEQNKPEPGSWKANTASENLDLYYKDGTAMCSIGFTEYAITVDRYGTSPSLEYVLQESVMLHGILDELNKLAFEMDDIDEENRLIQLKEPGDAIEKAREKLPARKD